MSDLEREVSSRYLPPLREHERGHHELAKRLIAAANAATPIIIGVGKDLTVATADLVANIKTYQTRKGKEIEDADANYETTTQHGYNQSVVGGRDVVFNCAPEIRLTFQAYGLGAEAISTHTSDGSRVLESKSLSYETVDLGRHSPLAPAGLPPTDDKARPEINGRSVRAGGDVNLNRVETLPTKYGEVLPRHIRNLPFIDVRAPGDVSAEASASVEIHEYYEDFSLDGTIILSASLPESGWTGQSKASFDLHIMAASTAPARVTLTPWRICDRDLLSQANGFTTHGNECEFRMSKTAMPFGEEYTGSVRIVLQTSAKKDPEKFRIRILQDVDTRQ